MSAWLQGVVTRPIREVTDVAKRVVDERDFTLRVQSDTRDEIGVLVRAFNDMLGEVDRHARALGEATQTLQHEIGERRAAEQALRIADRRKDEFLATLAHELRNPLAPLRNGLDMLRLPGLSADRLAQIRELMSRQLAQMVRLVDDLLDVSRISTGKLAVRLARVDLASVVASAVDTTRPLIEARGHRLTVDVPGEPIVVDADATRLAQVVSNLLNNAAKYTPPGGSIALRVVASDDEVEIRVTDSGIGIPPDMLERVFEMFTQVDTSLDRSTAGLGVGLSLARRLTELHGGTIEATSAGRDQGSTFVVRLPRVTHEAAAADGSTPAPSAAAGRHRILLADDNVDFATSLAFILRSMGHEVIVAHDGAEALEAARRFRPAFAFLDIGLPKMHGYALASALRDDPATRDSVLVAITGWGQERDRRQAREAGFDHHFVKPVGVDELLDLLARAGDAQSSVTPGGEP
jgi:signal transduction histidine kinase/ActR/RegA family two-component response regulator